MLWAKPTWYHTSTIDPKSHKIPTFPWLNRPFLYIHLFEVGKLKKELSHEQDRAKKQAGTINNNKTNGGFQSKPMFDCQRVFIALASGFCRKLSRWEQRKVSCRFSHKSFKEWVTHHFYCGVSIGIEKIWKGLLPNFRTTCPKNMSVKDPQIPMFSRCHRPENFVLRIPNKKYIGVQWCTM